jgi:hypothetical protein
MVISIHTYMLGFANRNWRLLNPDLVLSHMLGGFGFPMVLTKRVI